MSGAGGLSARLAAHAASLRYEDLPASAVADAKRVMLDTLACALPAANEAGVRELTAYALANGGREESLLWGCGARVPAATAALVNGTQAAALDYDSVHEAGSSHPSAVTLPAALAVAEREHRGGRDLLAALVVGDDLIARMTLAARGDPGWFYSSVYGVFAAAAVTGNLVGLDAETIRHAFGIALSGAAGTQLPLTGKSMTKRLQTALAARRGIEAALLAAAGVTGPREPLTSPRGLFDLYGEVDENLLTDGLGDRFEHGQVIVKKYPSCACNHAAITATLALAEEHGLAADDVAGVRVIASPYIHRLVGGPYEPGDSPQVAAQFSTAYSLAVILRDRRLGLPEIAPAFVTDPELRAIAARVQVIPDAGYIGCFAPVTVTLTLTDGRKLTRTQHQVPGTPSDPLGWEDVVEKFHDCARPVLGREGCEALVARVAGLEEMADVAGLLEGVVADAR